MGCGWRIASLSCACDFDPVNRPILSGWGTQQYYEKLFLPRLSVDWTSGVVVITSFLYMNFRILAYSHANVPGSNPGRSTFFFHCFLILSSNTDCPFLLVDTMHMRRSTIVPQEIKRETEEPINRE